MNPENFIWQLMARSLSGEASQEEIQLLHDALKADESLQQQYDILKQFWNSSGSPAAGDDEYAKDLSILFAKAKTGSAINKGFIFKTRISKRKRRLALLMGGIAIAVLLTGGLYLFLKTPDQHQTKLSMLVTRSGNRNRTILPDGSVVWLNAASTLSYDNSFKGQAREVYLKGEAFFDVVKKNDQPFIVHANGVDIKVLGTAFNVKSYVEDNKVEATLFRGVIQVTRQGENDAKPVFLHPNEKLVINIEEDKAQDKIKSGHPSAQPPAIILYRLDSTAKTENLAETSWMYNRLEFRGDSFKELAKKLERWYDVKIIFEDSSVEQLNFNGSFEKETIVQAFAALKTAASFDYTIEGNEIFVRSNKTIMPD